MSNYEGTRRQRLEWFEARVTAWQTNAAAIGLTAAQVTAAKALMTTNRTDLNASETARAAAKAATNTFYTSGNAMDNAVRDLIAVVKGFAQSTNNPLVYSLAQIEPPSPPSPIPAPDTPTAFSGAPTPDGVVTLTWKATPSGKSSGVFFLVERKRANEGAFSPIGATQEKLFSDDNAQLAAGVVQYRVRAARGQDASDWTTPIAFDLAGGGGGAGVAGFIGGGAAEAGAGGGAQAA